MNKVIIANLLVVLITNIGVLLDQYEAGLKGPDAVRILTFREEKTTF